MIPKFRAYVKEVNKTYEITEIDFGDEQLKTELGDWWSFDEVEIMQSTGLKDKNGVDIFEGDLVEHDDNINGTWETFEACEIVYDGDYAQFCFKNDASNFLSYYRNLCIIGNIHENPELLEVEE
ncbi:YopX family protein [Enterococcus faecalis]|uniref:YopX family protein n=1 Tax=Enterococcus faecalis TaxID=1351 RepID=UPI0018A7A263|nr:YopX family protein [Enterococcus faecalis]